MHCGSVSVGTRQERSIKTGYIIDVISSIHIFHGSPVLFLVLLLFGSCLLFVVMIRFWKLRRLELTWSLGMDNPVHRIRSRLSRDDAAAAGSHARNLNHSSKRTEMDE